MNTTFWGPSGWQFLHTLTFIYPEKPSYTDKVKMQKSRMPASESPRMGFEASRSGGNGDQSKEVDSEVYDDRAFYFLLLQSFLQSSNYDSWIQTKLRTSKEDLDSLGGGCW